MKILTYRAFGFFSERSKMGMIEVLHMSSDDIFFSLTTLTSFISNEYFLKLETSKTIFAKNDNKVLNTVNLESERIPFFV